MKYLSRFTAALAALLFLATLASPVEARGRGFICGLTQRLHFHLPPKFNLAMAWAGLPHTSAQVGAVVVQRRNGRALGGGPGGHVSRIERVISQCRAVVTDEKGTYERDICKNLVAYVKP